MGEDGQEKVKETNLAVPNGKTVFLKDMFKKLFTLLALSGAITHNFSAHGQELEPAPSAHNNTLLWRVSGKGLKDPSYFLGTMHILCPEDAYLSDGVMKVLDKVSEIYFEIDLDNMALMMTALRSMTMRNDTVLSDLLSGEEYKELENYFSGKLPLPFGVLKRMKPMLLASMLSEQLLPCKAGSGTEMLLSEEARKRSLKTGGLETPSYQFGLFDSIPYGFQAKELLHAVREEGKGSAGDAASATAKMLAAYQAQDLDALEKLTLSEEAGLSGYHDLLIFNRNKNWVEQFDKIAQGGSFLFAVGAGHLPGDLGVLKLLSSKGYTVTPLVNEKPQ